MSIKETIEVIKDAVTERISSPILGSFTFFFLGCNWPSFVIILKSQQPIEVVVPMLEASRISWFHSFFEPAILTLIFCAAYPWIKFGLSWYTDFIDTKRVLKRHDAELQIIRHRKEMIVAEGELEEIREERLRKSEREKLKFEHELTAKSDRDIESQAWKKLELENKLDRHKKLHEAQTEGAVKREKQHLGLIPKDA